MKKLLLSIVAMSMLVLAGCGNEKTQNEESSIVTKQLSSQEVVPFYLQDKVEDKTNFVDMLEHLYYSKTSPKFVPDGPELQDNGTVLSPVTYIHSIYLDKDLALLSLDTEKGFLYTSPDEIITYITDKIAYLQKSLNSWEEYQNLADQYNKEFEATGTQTLIDYTKQYIDALEKVKTTLADKGIFTVEIVEQLNETQKYSQFLSYYSLYHMNWTDVSQIMSTLYYNYPDLSNLFYDNKFETLPLEDQMVLLQGTKLFKAYYSDLSRVTLMYQMVLTDLNYFDAQNSPLTDKQLETLEAYATDFYNQYHAVQVQLSKYLSPELGTIVENYFIERNEVLANVTEQELSKVRSGNVDYENDSFSRYFPLEKAIDFRIIENNLQKKDQEAIKKALLGDIAQYNTVLSKYVNKVQSATIVENVMDEEQPNQFNYTNNVSNEFVLNGAEVEVGVYMDTVNSSRLLALDENLRYGVTFTYRNVSKNPVILTQDYFKFKADDNYLPLDIEGMIKKGYAVDIMDGIRIEPGDEIKDTFLFNPKEIIQLADVDYQVEIYPQGKDSANYAVYD